MNFGVLFYRQCSMRFRRLPAFYLRRPVSGCCSFWDFNVSLFGWLVGFSFGRGVPPRRLGM